MFKRIREAAQNISEAGAEVDKTAELISLMILELLDHGIDLSIKYGEKEIPLSLHIKIPQSEQTE